MTLLAIFSLLTGSILGIRFRFIILLPTIFLGSAALAVILFVWNETTVQAIWMVAIFASCIQLGYICALFVKYAMIPTINRSSWPLLRRPKFH
jgi:hypothetical protein